jgi:hypothetical protein
LHTFNAGQKIALWTSRVINWSFQWLSGATGTVIFLERWLFTYPTFWFHPALLRAKYPASPGAATEERTAPQHSIATTAQHGLKKYQQPVHQL